MTTKAVHYDGGLMTAVDCLRPKNENTQMTRTLGSVTCKACQKSPCFLGAVQVYGLNYTVPGR